MDDLTRMMRAAVEAPPPTHIDLDRLIVGEQRRRRNLTWASLGTGVAAAVAAILVVPAVLATPRPGGDSLSFGTPTAPVPGITSPIPTLCAPLSPSPTGPQPPVQSHDTVRARPTEPVDQAVPRLTQALDEALRATLPSGVSVAALVDGCTGPQFQWHPSYREYETSARVTRGDDAHFLLVRVMPQPAGEDGHCQGAPTDCTRTELPDGTVVTVVTTAEADGGKQHSVLVCRPDGTAVFLIENNYSLAPSNKGGSKVTATELPLTPDQLIMVGRHPGLTLYP